MHDVDLVAASHQNFIGAYRTLATHAKGGAMYEGHGVLAFSTGVPLATLNGCIAIEDASEDIFGGALGWLRKRGMPFRVWVHEPAVEHLGGVAAAFGLERQPDSYPGMALHPIPDPPSPPEGITIEEVSGDDTACLREVYAKTGMVDGALENLFGPSFRNDPSVRMFCARLDGDPVGTSLAIRTERVTGVYAVGTAKTARKRGVGTAATWAAIGAAKAWGSDVVVLQSSHMGLSIYRAMGFRVVAPYITFLRPQTS